MKLIQNSCYPYIDNNALSLIPMDWKVKRIKDVAVINSKSLNETTDKKYTFKYIDISNVNITGLITEPEYIEFQYAPSRARRIVKKNDVIISTVRTYLKAVAFFDKEQIDTIVSTGFAVLSHKINITPRFLSYYIQSENFIESVIRNSVGVSYPAINSSTLSSLFLYTPPLKEQIQIAYYLDQKIKVIDRKITLLADKISQYKEVKKAIINEAVCKGLDKNVFFKESGIDWIGKIPDHWEIKRGKAIFTEKSRKGFENEPLLAASQKSGVVLKSMLEQKSMQAQKDFHNFKLVEVGDFVISLRSFEGGIEIAYYRGIISPAYTVFSANKGLNTQYYKHLLKSTCFIQYLRSFITGIRDGQTIRYDEFKNIFFPIPSRTEQAAIGKYCTSSDRIGQVMAKGKRQMSKLSYPNLHDYVQK